jgi:hypothetical protein
MSFLDSTARVNKRIKKMNGTKQRILSRLPKEHVVAKKHAMRAKETMLMDRTIPESRFFYIGFTERCLIFSEK